MWTTESNTEELCKIIRTYFSKKSISGACMGSRSGEEQQLFKKYLGYKSKIVGVELSPEASKSPNTIIADFHFLPKYFLDSFDFVYSNSHDQSNNPRTVLDGWINCLRINGLLILEHSRAHGKSRVGRQDPFAIETELLPYVMMLWFRDRIKMEGIYTPQQPFDSGHKFLIFSRKM
jgi:hypothetical protein